MKINEVDKVTTLAPAECITAIAADGSLIQIPVSELAKVMAPLIRGALGLTGFGINTNQSINIPLEENGCAEFFSLSRFIGDGSTVIYPEAANYVYGMRVRSMAGDGIYESQLCFVPNGYMYIRAIKNGVLGDWKKVV